MRLSDLFFDFMMFICRYNFTPKISRFNSITTLANGSVVYYSLNKRKVMIVMPQLDKKSTSVNAVWHSAKQQRYYLKNQERVSETQKALYEKLKYSFVCETCNKQYATKAGLKRHAKTKTHLNKIAK